MWFDIDENSRAAMMADAVSALVIEGGLAAITMRRIAHLVGASPGAIANNFVSKEQLLEQATYVLTARGIRRLERHYGPGIGHFLPLSVDETAQHRVWLAMTELARTHESLAETVGLAREQQTLSLRRRLSHRVDRPMAELDLLEAVIAGLAEARCRMLDPLTPDRAAAALSRTLELIGEATETWPTGPLPLD